MKKFKLREYYLGEACSLEKEMTAVDLIKEGLKTGKEAGHDIEEESEKTAILRILELQLQIEKIRNSTALEYLNLMWAGPRFHTVNEPSFELDEETLNIEANNIFFHAMKKGHIETLQFRLYAMKKVS